MLETDLPPQADPTEQEIADFYHQHPEHFAVPPKIRVSRILILTDNTISPEQKGEKKKAIDQAHARAAKGEDFAKVANEVSQEKFSASKGGDIGFFQRSANEKPFDDMAFNTKVGSISPVVQTMVGYWVMKVTDSQPVNTTPLAEAHDHNLTFLRGQKKAQQAKDYEEKLMN